MVKALKFNTFLFSDLQVLCEKHQTVLWSLLQPQDQILLFVHKPPNHWLTSGPL